ncbi:protein kinase [Longibacter salinarum]|uniref:non-specific serine/threonine protein kinase n=1 Tax=Longibacter salinarum TaxID=1850348 RepID=A0A2A8D1K6_9BACT|nr:serine/threonine-protein kinase [Longibacter salinarum]PEN14774.1 protein kinase [Longibacter salinarum]
MIQVGDTIDGYRIADVIGRGGMGTVYRAVDMGLEKDVALKVIAPHLAEDPTFLARFRSEAKALARLDAPGIVRVLSLRESMRATFIAMEYVDGPPLREVLRASGHLDWPEAASILQQILSAVDHAHSSGVLHRDLKPSNILLTNDGSVKITDFGLAKIRTSDTDLTATHETAGTVAYMSPEQVEGLKHVDERSDLFSVGLMAYEMLTGQLPFSRSGSYYSIQRAIVQEPFDPPSAHVEDIPDRIDQVVMKLLEKDADQRFGSAKEALNALDPVDAPARVATPVVFDPPSVKPSEEAPANWMWAAGAAMAVTLIAAVVMGVSELLSIDPSPAQPTPVTADSMARLNIRTTPGAAIHINGDSIGESPLRAIDVAAGSVTVRAERPDFAPAETTFAADGSHDLSLILAEARSDGQGDDVATGTIMVRSSPAGAAVQLNGRDVGVTPVSLRARAGQSSIRIRKNGYHSYASRLRVRSGRETNISATLKPVPSTATLRFNPFATVTVDGEQRSIERVTSWTDSLAPGRHRIVARYRSAEWVRVVNLRPGEEFRRDVDFTKEVEVRIVAQNERGQSIPNAEILVDGTPSGYAPQQLELRVGRHRIKVRKAGYLSAQRVVDIDTDAGGRITFTLRTPEPSADSSR